MTQRVDITNGEPSAIRLRGHHFICLQFYRGEGYSAAFVSNLARVVSVFGSAHPHHAYVFANRRANRMKALVHDGIGVWLVARRLNAGKFVWTSQGSVNLQLSRTQLDALVLGLPWQLLGEAGVIRVI